MLRDSHRAARALLAILVIACVLAGCGIKGPLIAAPQPEAAKGSGSDTAPRKP